MKDSGKVNIKECLENVCSRIKNAAESCGRNFEDITLVAVSKTRTPEEINTAIACGITDIGENKVQEVLDKYESVDPVKWHMIGHLQTNKVRYIVDKVDLIHSVDSLKLAKEIDKRVGNIGKTMDILIQINPADEESKFGVSLEEVRGLVEEILDTCENIRIKGLMSVAPKVDNPEDVKPFFEKVKAKYDELSTIDNEKLDFKYLSMGMSHDFEVAIRCGANIVRVGSAIFGERDYEQFRKAQEEK